MAGSAANSMARYAELNRSNSTPNQVRGSRRYDWAGLASYAARLFCERIIPVSTVCDRETKASPDRNRHMRSATSSKVVSGNRSLPIRALLGAAAAGSQKRCRAHLPGTLPNRILDGLDRLRPDYWCEIPFAPANAQEVPIWAVAVWPACAQAAGAHRSRPRRQRWQRWQRTVTAPPVSQRALPDRPRLPGSR